MRHALKLRGYKKGRISQLVSLTRPTSSASSAGAAAGHPASGQSGGEVGEETEVVVQNKDEVFRVLQEVAEDEKLNEEVRGCLEILQDREDAELPRLYGKQTPRGAWSHVVAPAWVKEILALFPEPGAEEGHVEELEEGLDKKKLRKRCPSETCPGRGPSEPCQFTQRAAALGQAARLTKGEAACKFCDAEKLNASFAAPQQRKFLTRACRVWLAAGREDVMQAAVERMTEEQKSVLETALARPSRAAAAVEARAVAKAETEAWEKLLEPRCTAACSQPRKSRGNTGKRRQTTNVDYDPSSGLWWRQRPRMTTVGGALWQQAWRNGAKSLRGEHANLVIPW